MVNIDMSSAKIRVVVSVDVGMSDRKMLKSNGERADPCGTPVRTGKGSERDEPTETTALLPVR